MAGERAAGTKTVLIVDDDDSAVQTFGRMLKMDGYDVMSADCVAAGLARAGERRPDAILLDLHMPFGDGIAFLEQLRGRRELCDVPVAIATGDYLIADAVIERAKGLGADVHFKPLWLDDLIAIVRALLDGRKELPT
jgi:DNA-binding response OmpR family regulator